MEARLSNLENRVAILEGDSGQTKGSGDDSLVPSRAAAGTDAQILKKVSTRLQDFEAQITAQLSNMQSDFDKKLSHVNRGASSMKPLDSAGPSAGFRSLAEDVPRFTCESFLSKS